MPPPRTSSRARPFPTSLGRRCVPAKPGVRPSLTSGWPNFAVSAASRTVQAIASSHPPPSANPLTAAMTGFPSRSIRSNTPCPSSACALPASGVSVESSLMSAPATNAFSPAPVRMTTRTASSACSARIACPSSASVAALSALSTFGRLTVTVARAPSSSTRRLFVRHPVTRSRARLYPTLEWRPPPRARPARRRRGRPRRPAGPARSTGAFRRARRRRC